MVSLCRVTVVGRDGEDEITFGELASLAGFALLIALCKRKAA